MTQTVVEALSIAGIKGGTARKHKWVDEERDIVRRDYRGTNASAAIIGAMLGVTLCAVRGQVANMGLSKKTDRKRWDDRQDGKLVELITQYAPATVAKMMHRGVNSVVLRAKRLGLSRRVRDGWYTKREVCEILGVDHKWVQRRIDNGELKAAYNNPDRKPQQGGMAYWRIQEEDLRAYIRRYPQELNGHNVDLIQIVDILVGLDT